YGNVEAAQKLCRDGLIWEAQIFSCESYYPDVEVRQCFKCYRFGHIARFCSAPARCGYCGTAVYAGGEPLYPQFAVNAKKRYTNYNGNHTTWDRRCPEAKKQYERADEAYRFRPRQFAVAGNEAWSPPESVPTGSPIMPPIRPRPDSE